ncbi:MAG: glycosyltransferase [bacterium]
MRQNVLILHPNWPKPDLCSGDYQMFQQIRLLRQAGHAVTVAGLNRIEDANERQRYGQALVDLGCEVEELFPHPYALSAWGLEVVQEKLRHIVERNGFDAAFISFYNVAGQFIPLLRQVAPRLRIVIHSWDVSYLRETRGAALTGHLPRLKVHARSRGEEMSAYAMADAVLAVTDGDGAVINAGMSRELANRRLPENQTELPPVITLPHVHPLTTSPLPTTDRRDMVFVGYFGHLPNQDAALWLGREIWPLVATQLPDVKLKIVGADPPEPVTDLASDQIEVLGFVPDLESLLDQVRVSVAPLRYGAGLKGKVSQALAAGLPVVTTAIGAEGIPVIDGVNIQIGETAQELAAKLVRLYTDTELWSRQAHAGQAVVQANYSDVPVAAALFHALFGELPEAAAVTELPVTITALDLLCDGICWQYDQRCPPQAAACFQAASDLDPTLFLAHLALAVLLLEQGQPDAAAEAWQAAHTVAPLALGVRAVGAELLAIRGEHDRARQIVELAITEDPNHPQLMRLRGELALATGDGQAALRYLQEAQELYPGDFWINHAFGRLAQAAGRHDLATTLFGHLDHSAGNTGRNREQHDLRQQLKRITSALAGSDDRLPAEVTCLPDHGWRLPTAAGNAGDPTASTPRVSIIIPVYDKLDLTRQCLQALADHTSADQHEIIVVDNGSGDGSREFLRAEAAAGRLVAIINDKNRGFATACNQGAARAHGEYLLFLNNDTVVQDGWLEPLVALLDDDPQVAAAGSKLLFPDGTIQHAGVIIADDRKLPDPLVARHIYYREAADLPEANQRRTYQALTAACLLIRRELFTKVNGFDESYRNGYEDIDLCFRLQQDGWRLVYEPTSVVIHHESQSGPVRFAHVADNIRRLHQRWLQTIEPDLLIHPDGRLELTGAKRIRVYEPGVPEKLAASSGTPRASIVVLTHNALDFTRQCADSLLAHTSLDHEVIFVDNGSSDGSVEYLTGLARLHAHIRLLANETNLGYAAGNNLGLAAARGEYLVILNNDVVVTPGWLERLVACADAVPNCGLVGPVTNQISGPQMLPAVTYDTTSLEGLAQFAAERGRTHAGRSDSHWRVVGFCLLVKRAVIDTIGGFDERFGRGNFEDDDFCLRSLLAGFTARVAHDCFVHHFGGRTFLESGVDYNQSLVNNWLIFRQKWGVPEGVSYLENYDMSPHLQGGFDVARHYCPLVEPMSHSADTTVETAPETARPDEPTPTALAQRISQGEEQFATGCFTEAVSTFRDILAHSPENLRVRNDLACALWEAGQAEVAITELVATLEMAPDHPDAVWNLGQFLQISDRIDEAIQLYRNYLQLRPEAREIAAALEQMQQLAVTEE